jgi:hypothetical protein
MHTSRRRGNRPDLIVLSLLGLSACSSSSPPATGGQDSGGPDVTVPGPDSGETTDGGAEPDGEPSDGSPAPDAVSDAPSDAPSDAEADGSASDAGPDAPVTCKTILAAHPGSQSGLYTIDLDGSGTQYPPITVYCDMAFDGGGWTMVQSYTGADSPDSLLGGTDDAGVLKAPPQPEHLGALAAWIVAPLAAMSSQVHIRHSFAADAGSDGGLWITSRDPSDGGATYMMANLRSLKLLNAGTDGGFDDWTGPQATAARLAWVPNYGGDLTVCGNPVAATKYPSVFWACGNFTSMDIYGGGQGICRWNYNSGGGPNEPMEVYVR